LNDIKKIETNALYLYANKEPKNLHNNLALLQATTQDYPVAKLRASTTKQNGMEPGLAMLLIMNPIISLLGLTYAKLPKSS
jgi:hypothetical protein